MPNTNTTVASATAISIQRAELVKEASSEPIWKASRRLISNCSIGLCISSPLPLTPVSSGEPVLPFALLTLTRLFRVDPDGTPRIVGAGREPHDQAPDQGPRRPAHPTV